MKNLPLVLLKKILKFNIYFLSWAFADNCKNCFLQIFGGTIQTDKCFNFKRGNILSFIHIFILFV